LGAQRGDSQSAGLAPVHGTKSEPLPTLEQVQGPNGPELQRAYFLRQGVFPFSHRPGPYTAAGASQKLAAWVGPFDRVTIISLWRDGLKLSHWESGELGMSGAKAIAITPDNERLVAVNSVNVIVVMDLPTKQIVRYWTAWVSEGRAVVHCGVVGLHGEVTRTEPAGGEDAAAAIVRAAAAARAEGSARWNPTPSGRSWCPATPTGSSRTRCSALHGC
jgi:hypothetical protein